MVIDESQLLSKVHHYQLQRPNKETVRIEIHEVLLDPNPKFVSVPVDEIGLKSKIEKYMVQGSTEEEALETLVELIKQTPREEIFPKEK